MIIIIIIIIIIIDLFAIPQKLLNIIKKPVERLPSTNWVLYDATYSFSSAVSLIHSVVGEENVMVGENFFLDKC